jgi:GntR family transcriptional regulator
MQIHDSPDHPLYLQIKAVIQKQIETGELQIGERAASERELSETFNVSRMTARQALKELEQEGYLERVRGRGSFVAVPKVQESLLELVSFSEDMQRRGLTASSKVLSVNIQTPERHIASRLEISLSTKVVCLERLRYAASSTMSYEKSYLPQTLVPNLDKEDLSQSLYHLLLTKYGIRLSTAEQSLEGMTASQQHAKLLEIPVGSVLLKLERVSRDERGTPVEFVQAFYRADRYVFTAQLRRL